LIGTVEAGAAGYAAGWTTATLRNWGLSAYASLLRRRAAAELRSRVLDEI
jgi:hypothetical protein